ncbi:hypothetical protein CPB86DRAFT_818985 [Serendipita vermifera]|nr:hypothetical protein CPB86DRAFT_818985 [Serendipita vermifera]
MSELYLADLNDSQVTDLRWQLQNNISNLIREKELGLRLREKTIAYNQVVDELHNRDTRPRVDPLEKLPREIITKILHELSYHVYFIPDLLTLTLVSKTWQDFILSEPLLWNNFVLDDINDLVVIASVQMRLSGHAPIHLHLHVPTVFEQWEFLYPILLDGRDRIEDITLYLEYHMYPGDDDRNDTDMWRILASLGSLPKLREIGNSWLPFRDVYNVKRLLDSYPALQYIKNIPFTLGDLEVAKGKLDIRSVATYDSIESMLPALETERELREVTFCTEGSWFWRRDSDSKEPAINLDLDHQLGWTELIYERSLYQLPSTLLRCALSLTQLEAHLTIKGLNTILPIIHQLQKLDQVTFNIQMDTNDTMSVSPDLSPNIRACGLHVNVFCDIDTPPLLEDLRHSNVVLARESLVELLLRAMPNIDRLTLLLYCDKPYVPFPVFEGCFLGRYLNLSFAYNSLNGSHHTSIPLSTQSLDLTCDRDVLCSLSSRTLKSLSAFEPHLPTGSTTRSLDCRLDLDEWPNLEKLCIYGDAVAWHKSSLAFLKKVTISLDDTRARGNNVTSFIQHLACHPKSYPSLEEISLRESPEWDILMIMLERRNLLQEPDIKMITKISVHSPCSIKIQQIIKTLLRGKWAQRPSNRDLSLAGNAPVLLDLELPGCYMCHRGLRSCDLPVTKRPEGYDNDLIKRLQIYPEDEDEILETWDERTRAWEEIDRAGAGRQIACSLAKNAVHVMDADYC